MNWPIHVPLRAPHFGPNETLVILRVFRAWATVFSDQCSEFGVHKFTGFRVHVLGSGFRVSRICTRVSRLRVED